jgi:hypothetical protein
MAELTDEQLCELDAALERIASGKPSSFSRVTVDAARVEVPPDVPPPPPPVAPAPLSPKRVDVPNMVQAIRDLPRPSMFKFRT